MIGKTISHYRITEKIGEGGMGVVYKALDTTLDRHVAIKFLPPHLRSDEQAKTRFVHEAKAASALNHANIAVVHEIGETPDGQMFIVMAFYEGQTLKGKLEGGPLDVDDAISIVSQLASGLGKAHEKKILHRDIKPANILMGDDGHAKLADFGLAKLAGRTQMTKTGSTLGTVSYMSPEQASGGDVDHRSDIFSLGVVLYELLTGKRPFRGDHDAAVLYGIMNSDPTPLVSHRSGLPPGLKRVVNTALAKDPSSRYQSIDDMLSNLANVRSVSAPSASTRRPQAIFKYGLPALAAFLTVFLLVVIGPFKSNVSPDAVTEVVKLAVLPFENLGASEDEYFADGITDEITSRLAIIAGLAVISRTSSQKYKDTDKGLREIGQELGVDYILEGTIRWDKRGEHEKVRITPQLINVSNDFYLWAENYEREIAEIFEVQADIASQIAEALDITLLESERQILEARPTDNLEAYQAYLRGLDYTWNVDFREDDIRLGIQMLERAVELDPEFALSYAAISRAHSGMHHLGYDRTEERLSRAKAAVDKALELQPKLPEAHMAFALYHYWCHRDYERALEELAIAERGLPNNARTLELAAWIWRRQGKFEAAANRMKRAFELSPQDANLALEIGLTYKVLRRYAEVDRYMDLSISLAPDRQSPYRRKAHNYVSWLGDTKRAREVLEKMPGESRDVQEQSLRLWRLERNYGAILDFSSSDSRQIIWEQDYVWTPALLAAMTYHFMGETELAHASYDSARSILEKELDAHPDDNRIHIALGFAYAGLGREEEAVREGKRAVELYPVSKDKLDGPNVVQDLAVIYTMVGEYDSALDEIEYLLSIPSYCSVQDLRLDPIWDPLRDHPRFQRILREY